MFGLWRLRAATLDNPVPKDQPVVYNSRMKIGVGGGASWNDLPYIGESLGEAAQKRSGPYRVDFDTEDFDSEAGCFLGLTLSAGAVIEQAWLESVDVFVPEAGDAVIAINLCDVDDPEDTFEALVSYDLDGNAQNTPNDVYVATLLDVADTTNVLPVRVVVDSQVRVSGQFEGGLDTEAGAVDLYVLYSEASE